MANFAVGAKKISTAQANLTVAAAGDIISVYAGGTNGDSGLAVNAYIGGTGGVVFDSAGNFYVFESESTKIRKVDSITGIISTIAGTGVAANSGDGGLAINADIHATNDLLTIDSADNLYFGSNDHTVRKINTGTGVISTVAGTGVNGFSGDGGLATAAELSNPGAIDIDSADNIYFYDSSYRIRKIDAATGIINTIVGTGVVGNTGDGGLATAATVSTVSDMVVDSSDNLYIYPWDAYAVRVVDSATGIISKYAGTGVDGNSGDGGLAIDAQIRGGWALSINAADDLFISTTALYTRKVDRASGIITTIAGTGNGNSGIFHNEGDPALAADITPYRMVNDSLGNLYFADASRIIKLTIATGLLSSVAGNGGYGGDGGSATSAYFQGPNQGGYALDTAGNLYFADMYNYRVRKIDYASGAISTVAGTGVDGYSGDGSLSTAAQIGLTRSVAVDSANNIYVADYEFCVIRKVNGITGLISTIAGTAGNCNYAGDGGLAVDATFDYPNSIAVNSSGDVYIMQETEYTIRKISASTGLIERIAGSFTWGYSGDGGLAVDADIATGNNYGMAFDSLDNLYFSQYNFAVVRKIDNATGIISTVAGDGTFGYYNGSNQATGLATIIPLNGPVSVAVDSNDDVYIYDVENYVIMKLTQATGVMTRLAGIPQTNGYSGNGGHPMLAKLNSNNGIAIDSAHGRLYLGGNDSLSPGVIRQISLTVNPDLGGNINLFVNEVGDGLPATSTSMYPRRVAFDSNDNLYFSDDTRIRKIDKNTLITSTIFTSTNSGIQGLAYDESGYLYFGEFESNQIKKIDLLTQSVSVVAGTGTPGHSGDGGLAIDAEMKRAEYIDFDSLGNLYFAENVFADGYLRKIDTSGIISTIASGLGSTFGVTVDSSGNVYYSANSSGCRVIKLAAGTWTSSDYAGTGVCVYGGDGGLATVAQVYYPISINMDSQDNLYITESGDSNRIRYVDNATGIITTVAGNGVGGFAGDGGLAVDASLNYPTDAAEDSVGNFYIADQANNRIRKVDAITQNISTYGGFVAQQFISSPDGIAVDSLGNVYLSVDPYIYKFTSSSAMSIYAGTGVRGYSGDGGLATAAEIRPYLIHFDANDNLFFTNTTGSVVRKIDQSTGIITTVAGNGTVGYSGDGGLATDASFDFPVDVVIDSVGNLYIADEQNEVVRKVTATTGMVETIAGGGIACDLVISASCNALDIAIAAPRALALADDLFLYITDRNNKSVLKLNLDTMMVSVYAGFINQSIFRYDGDGGPANDSNVLISSPMGIAVNSNGDLYISDSNQVIRKVEDLSQTISTVAGNGTYGASGDGGLAVAASLSSPRAVAIDSALGKLYIAGNDGIRVVSIPAIVLADSNTSRRSWLTNNQNVAPEETGQDGVPVTPPAEENNEPVAPPEDGSIPSEVSPAPEQPILSPTPEERQIIEQIYEEEFGISDAPASSPISVIPTSPTEFVYEPDLFVIDTQEPGQERLVIVGQIKVVGDNVEFSGTSSQANTVINLIIDGNQTITVTSDADGNWTTYVSFASLGVSAGETKVFTVEAIGARADLRSERVVIGTVTVAKSKQGDRFVLLEPIVSSVSTSKVALKWRLSFIFLIMLAVLCAISWDKFKKSRQKTRTAKRPRQ